jgi:hypothetical protein
MPGHSTDAAIPPVPADNQQINRAGITRRT